MDLNTVRRIRQPRTRAEVFLEPGETYLAGGTWLFSEPQPQVAGLVDLTALGWAALTPEAGGLTVAATCTLAELRRVRPGPDWRAFPLFDQCVNSLVASFKVWNTATLGGNLCTALPAGSLISLTAALESQVLIWTAGGGERTMSVVDFVLGAQQTALQPGEVLRSVHLGGDALRSRTAYRKIALAPLGRSGSLVIGRRGEHGEVVFTVTAATPRPHQLRYPDLPYAVTLAGDVAALDDWYDDPHGTPAWRAHVTSVLAEEIRQELAEETAGA